MLHTHVRSWDIKHKRFNKGWESMEIENFVFNLKISFIIILYADYGIYYGTCEQAQFF